MAAANWVIHSYIIMSTLSCHVYDDHTDQDAPYCSVVYLHISPNCYYSLSNISVPKPIFTALKEKAPKNIYSQKLIRIKTSIFGETKGQSTLVMTFDLTFMGCT